MTSIAATLFGPKRIEPSYPKLPLVDGEGRSSIDGVYVVGDAAGTPLLKLGMNAGAKAGDAIAAELARDAVGPRAPRAPSPPDTSPASTPTSPPSLASAQRPEGGSRPPEAATAFDVVVVGAGASGLACALRLKKRGKTVVVVDGNAMAQTVVSMTKGKHIFAEPTNVKNESDLWLDECTREQLLERWQQDVSKAGVDVREHCRVDDIKRERDGLIVRLANKTELRARRVVVAVGKSGSPRKANVPGEAEHASRIRHSLDDASLVRGRSVLVYGGGDVACEAALALSAPELANRVTMATIDRVLTFPKKRNRDAIERANVEGRVSLRLDTKLAAIDATSCRLQGGIAPAVSASGAAVSASSAAVNASGAAVNASGAAVNASSVDADLVYIMIGADPPVAFFRKLGLALDGDWTVRRYLIATLVFLGVYSLYALKKFPETPFSWPFTLFVDEASFRAAVGSAFHVAFAPFAWIFDVNARADIDRTLWFQQGYLYSLLYTIAMLGFGWRALMRWRGIAKRPRYQTYRYLTLLAFQLVFFLAANVVAVQALSIQNSWRAWGLYQPWPLFFNTFHWWSASDPRAVELLFIGGGLVGTFVAIPLLAWKNGKRFCTWVCGCGGLAETLGDQWRHLAPKGSRSRAWEFQSFVVLGAAALATVVTVGAYDTRADNGWAQAYSYIVDFWLVAVIPVALYPFFGGKIWCRYWCPLAAWNQILARWYGRLGIASNDHCISCGQCSKNCEVGVDVMQFARSQERFDNRNSSCIQCGICVDVCPVDVLSFDVRKRGELKVLS